MFKNLLQIKNREMAHLCQIILIDADGYVSESCDSLFDTSAFYHTKISTSVALLESLFPILLELSPSDPKLEFSKVEEPAPFLKGYYDFSFSKVQYNEGELILWTIYDFTRLYKEFLEYQQKRNEINIEKEYLEKDYERLRQTLSSS